MIRRSPRFFGCRYNGRYDPELRLSTLRYEFGLLQVASSHSTICYISLESPVHPPALFNHNRQNAAPNPPPAGSNPLAPPHPPDTLSPLLSTADNNLPRVLLAHSTTPFLSSRPSCLHLRPPNNPRRSKTALPRHPNALPQPARLHRQQARRQQEAHPPQKDRGRRAGAKRGAQGRVEARGGPDKD